MCTGKQIENEAGEPTVQGQDQGWEQGVVNVGQIDVAARNKEIYQKHKKGIITAQLAREYCLSPEWIRRICEDEERDSMRNKKGDQALTSTDRERNEIKKSMAYDLIQVLEEHSDQEIYTAEEVKQLIKEYIATATK